MPLAAPLPSMLVPAGDAADLEPWIYSILAINAVVTILAAVWSSAELAERLRRGLLAFALRPAAWLAVVLLAAVAYQVRRDGATSPDAASATRSTSSTSESSSVSSLEGAEWPVERGSNWRHARVGESPGPGGAAPQRRWRFGRSDEAFYGSAAVRGNVVYAVGSEPRQARVAAVSLDDGQLLWSGGPRDYRPTFASPVIVGSMLVAAEGLHATRQARVFALDLRPRREGALLWQLVTESHVECTPAVAAGRLYFNAGDDGVYGYRLPTSSPLAAAPPTAQPIAPLPLFHRPGGELPDAETSLLVHNDRVYVGLGVGGNALASLDAATGRLRHRLETPYPVFAPPALFEDRLFVGMGGGDYLDPSAAHGGALWRLNAATGAPVWRRELPATVLGAVLVDATQVIVGCGDGRVVAHDHEGQVVATWDLNAPIAASLALTPDFLYGVTQSGWLFALDRRRREVAWRVEIGRPGPYMSGPVVVGDQLVLGTPYDGLVCYGP